MIDNNSTSSEKEQARNLQFLLCDPRSGVELSSPEEVWVSTAIHCLDKAVENSPPVIVIRFHEMLIREREALVELCTVLKRNSHTQKCLVLALLHSKHRKLIEELDRAGVDYVRYVPDVAVDSSLIREIIRELGPDDRSERHLHELCPFLHYCSSDAQHEMTVCGAYLDRMVLGGRWLNQVCQTRDHLRCQYYLNPRPTS